VERVDTDDRLRGVVADTLIERGTHVHAHRGDPGSTLVAEFSEERVQGGSVFAGCAPHDLLAGMVRDQGSSSGDGAAS
jgi:hypothetical protein